MDETGNELEVSKSASSSWWKYLEKEVKKSLKRG
jgi:hypothetical protein